MSLLADFYKNRDERVKLKVNNHTVVSLLLQKKLNDQLSFSLGASFPIFKKEGYRRTRTGMRLFFNVWYNDELKIKLLLWRRDFLAQNLNWRGLLIDHLPIHLINRVLFPQISRFGITIAMEVQSNRHNILRELSNQCHKHQVVVKWTAVMQTLLILAFKARSKRWWLAPKILSKYNLFNTETYDPASNLSQKQSISLQW